MNNKKNSQSDNVGDLTLKKFELNNDTIDKTWDENKKVDQKDNYINLLNKFCDRYMKSDIKKLNIEKLEKIYEDGNMILDLFYVSIDNINTEQEKIMKLQYIISNIIYEIQNKKYDIYTKQTDRLNGILEKSTAKNKQIQRELNKANNEIRKIRNDYNSIITTIISMVLGISVITAAIAGIEKIDPNYILPFTLSIVTFGMLMIIFIYSIYREKIKPRAYILFVSIIIVTIILWFFSLNKWCDISGIRSNSKIDKTNQEEVNIYESGKE